MKNTVLKDKSYLFGLSIKLSRHLTTEYKQYVLAKQVLRSGTSIGQTSRKLCRRNPDLTSFTNSRSRIKRRSKQTFGSGYSFDSGLLTEAQATSLLKDCDELQRMLIASIKTTKHRLR